MRRDGLCCADRSILVDERGIIAARAAAFGRSHAFQGLTSRAFAGEASPPLKRAPRSAQCAQCAQRAERRDASENKNAAGEGCVPKTKTQPAQAAFSGVHLMLWLVGRARLERATNGLKVRCSTD